MRCADSGNNAMAAASTSPLQFTATSVTELFKTVRDQPLAFPPEGPASPPLQDLLTRLLAKVCQPCIGFCGAPCVVLG